MNSEAQRHLHIEIDGVDVYDYRGVPLEVREVAARFASNPHAEVTIDDLVDDGMQPLPCGRLFVHG